MSFFLIVWTQLTLCSNRSLGHTWLQSNRWAAVVEHEIAPDVGPVRQCSARQEYAGRQMSAQQHRSGHYPRADGRRIFGSGTWKCQGTMKFRVSGFHRRPELCAGAISPLLVVAGCGGMPQDHHSRKVAPHRQIRFRLRHASQAQQSDGCPQSQHHETGWRPLPALLWGGNATPSQGSMTFTIRGSRKAAV